MKRVPLLAAFALALVASPAWAYGRYQHTDTAGMVLETIRPFLTIILMSLIPYLICSIWMDRVKGAARLLPLLLDLGVVIGLVMPSLFVLGEFGPAHVAMSGAGPSCLIFPALLFVKFILLSMASARYVPMATLVPAK